MDIFWYVVIEMEMKQKYLIWEHFFMPMASIKVHSAFLDIHSE